MDSSHLDLWYLRAEIWSEIDSQAKMFKDNLKLQCAMLFTMHNIKQIF